ncbi:MAG: TetR/AcrR family transcriptional regulator [Pseudomonadota bacterium]
MSSVLSELTPVDTRTQILDCAESRFRMYGYGKTTMAEIARDASMSAANLYRYFESKQELGVACAKRCMEELFAVLRQVVRGPCGSARACLEDFAGEIALWTHDQCGEEPRINELVEMILSERQDIVFWRESRVTGLIAEILSRGNDAREFDVDNVIEAAQSIHSALTMFQLPVFMGLYDRDELERRARALAELLCRGLQAR